MSTAEIFRNKSLFGCYHTTGGRFLPELSRTAAIEDVANKPAPAMDPVKHIIEGARGYAHLKGMADPHSGIDYHKINQSTDRIRQLGEAYDALPAFDHHAVPHFAAMRDEVNHQYHHLTHAMGVDVQTVGHDPYRNAHEMIHDLHNNRRLQVLGTAHTGSHPFFSDEENDKFRAVHDAFGHAGTGRDFDAHGEEAAFHAHARMFSPMARGALASETRGQNGSLIRNGSFSPQKIALMPHRLWTPQGLEHTSAKTSELPDVLYKGLTGHRLDQVRESGGLKSGNMGESGPGVYLSKSKEYARRFAGGGGTVGGAILHVTHNVQNPLVRRFTQKDVHSNPVGDAGDDEYRGIQQEARFHEIDHGLPYMSTFGKHLADHGYDAVITHFHNGAHEVAVHDPSHLQIQQVERTDNDGHTISTEPWSKTGSKTAVSGFDMHYSASTELEDMHYTASDEDWRMSHRPPHGEEDDGSSPLHDLTHNLPADVYTHPHYYSDMHEKSNRDAHRVIQQVRNQPDAPVHIYRALPAEHAHKGIKGGDWVTTSKDYAIHHGQQYNETGHDDWPVIHSIVPAHTLRTHGDDFREYGYNGPDLESNVVHEGGKNQQAILHKESVQSNSQIFWHGSPSGDMRGGAYGLHVGTQEAARQALHARIGKRADGKDWDGTQEYGKTLLAGRDNVGPYEQTGHMMHAPREDYYPHPDRMPSFGDGTKVQPHHKPDLFPVRITGEMSNTPETAHEDFKANGYMKAQLSRGRAKRGYFYRNEGEDAGSISAVVPGPGHIERLDRKESKIAIHIRDYVPGQHNDWYHGTKSSFDQFQDVPPVNPHASDWNTSIGNHFASAKSTAHSFAKKDYEDDPPGKLFHTSLAMKNPKVYQSEWDMSHEVMKHEAGQGNLYHTHPDQHAKMLEYDSHRAGRRIDSTLASKGPDAITPPRAGLWLDDHPDKVGIATRFKERLKDQGHDGIVYGNEYERPKKVASAIPFSADQIEIHKVTTPSGNVDLRQKVGMNGKNAPKNAEEVRPFNTMETSVQRFAVLVNSGSAIADALPKFMPYVAHVSGNSIDVLHCPFCGSGAVIARSDGTIECGYCTSTFTVQVQPAFNAFPQSVNGQDYPWPGAPDEGSVMAPDAPAGTNVAPSMQSSDPGDLEDSDDESNNNNDDDSKPDFLKGKGDSDSDSKGDSKSPFSKKDDKGKPAAKGDDKSDKDNKKSNPFSKKKSYITSTGAKLNEREYLAHLAIVHAENPLLVAQAVKKSW